ncbi:MAG: dihydroorotase family protein [Candidatus Lokiarchaeota archaeon]|nr:dihydroorotase family protein [Candidatus Lokiarchaeota archaeon]
MILQNLKIFSEGILRKGALVIHNGKIKSIYYNESSDDQKENHDKIIDCKEKLVIPGIIDIHSHLRDLGQSEKETFLTATKAAAVSGITTVFNMPNTIPPAITAEQVKSWMYKAEKKIFVNVGFISGIPKNIDLEEISKIINLGVIGFKIYPLGSINEIDWTNPLNIQKILRISSDYQIPIFIHPDFSLTKNEKDLILKKHQNKEINILKLHNELYPPKKEVEYVEFILNNYYNFINDNNTLLENYPTIHFCHISCKDSYLAIKNALKKNERLKISFEITPHHLFLTNDIKLKNPNYGKVLPPLRDKHDSQFLFNELKKGNIQLIGTDHAPHTIKEKNQNYIKAPSGFPGFETYPLILLDKVCNFELSLDLFISITSQNPAKTFNIKNKGFIKEGYDADLVIIDKIQEYPINSEKFESKAKFSPFENIFSRIQIWKVFLKGIEINKNDSHPKGQIIKRNE